MSTIGPCLSVPVGKREEWNCLLHCWWLGMALLSLPDCRPKLLSLYQKPPWPAQNKDCAAVGRTFRQSEDCDVLLGLLFHAQGISQHLPVLFWTTISRIPLQRRGHNWPISTWKPVKNLEKTSPFLGACVRFCMSQGLNLHSEDLPPFSMAEMLIQMVTWNHTKLLSYSVIKIHWKCTNKNYNKGQLDSFFFSYSHKEHFKRWIADWGTTRAGMRIIWGW